MTKRGGIHYFDHGRLISNGAYFRRAVADMVADADLGGDVALVLVHDSSHSCCATEPPDITTRRCRDAAPGRLPEIQRDLGWFARA
jgi:hypothetical protein